MNRIGQYRIEGVLSTGGMSTLLLGRHHQMGRLVAIKQLHPHLSQDHSLVRRFEREARILGGLNHPNIVNILDFFQRHGVYYIVLEYIAGCSLKELLARRNSLPAVAAIYIGEQVAQGLCYAHERGVVHRDIKPANIMLTKEGLVKITDFGLAFVKEAVNLTDPGTFFGTPAYLAPEQIKGQSGDERSDLFSLGILLYEMLSGANPFQGESASQSIDRILRYQPAKLSSPERTMPPRLEDLILSLLNKDPQRRPLSAREAAQKLQPYLFFNHEGLARLLADPVNYRPRQEDEASWLKLARRERGIWQRKRILLYATTTVVVGAVGWWAYGRIVFDAQSRLRQPTPGGQQETIGNPGAARVMVSAKVASPITGKLKISGTTGARISLNGREQGNIPLSLDGLEPGQHQIRAELSGYQTMEKWVRIEPDRQAEIVFNLTPQQLPPGYLQITVNPWAEVYIDGRFIDRTPLSQPIKLDAGRRQLMLRHPNRLEYIQDLSIASDETLRISVKMPEAWGYLKLSVEPWADVFVDGRLVGTTPMEENLKLSIGEHDLKLRGPGGREWRETIRIMRDDTLRLRIDLTL